MALLEWVEFLPEVVALATYPDRLPAPRTAPASVKVDVFAAALTPPLTLPVYPHVVRAPARMPPSFVALPPQPERTAPLAQPVYPDAVHRPSLPAALQQAFATSPQPEARVPGWGAIFPDAFPPRRGPAVGFVVLPLAPEEPAPDVWLPWYPEHVARTFLGPALQQAWAYGQPEGTPFAESPCPNLRAAIIPMPGFTVDLVPVPAVVAIEVAPPIVVAYQVAMPSLAATIRCGC